MAVENFYGGNITLHGDLPSVELRQSIFGGVDIFLNGHEVPGVLDFAIDRNHPFPHITLRIGMTSLTFPDGYSLDDGGSRGGGKVDWIREHWLSLLAIAISLAAFVRMS